jgi:pimeloyl-ACP methyl ester carboxylesterase
MGAHRTVPPVQPVPSTDDVTVAVHDLGGELGAPVLLLSHATGFHGRAFAPMVEAGLTERFHCIAPDWRGHGDSVVPHELDYAWQGFAEDVEAVLDHLDSRPIYGFGHSMGGAALLMAEADRPGTFAGLFLFEPIVPPPGIYARPDGVDNPLAAGAERRREVFDSYEAAIENYASKPPLNVFTPEALRAYVEGGFAPQPDGTVLLKCRGRVEAMTFRMAAANGMYDRLADVRCPVTVATGVDEPLAPSAFAPAIVEGLPNGRLLSLDPLGHFGPMEDPPTLAQAILSAFP